MTGIERIAAERERQTSALGYDAAHDDRHVFDEIARAAAVFSLPWAMRTRMIFDRPLWGHLWPREWQTSQSHPPTENGTAADRIDELAKAGALIAAEIDRIERRIGRSDAAALRSAPARREVDE